MLQLSHKSDGIINLFTHILTKKLFQNLLILTTGVIFLLTSLSCPAIAGKPTVTVLPFDTSRAGKFAYLGNAIQQMLISRLGTEQLEVIPAGASASGDDADFIVRGNIVNQARDKVAINLQLEASGSDTPVAAWEITPATLDAIVPETGRYSLIISQKISDIENQRAVLASITDTINAVEGSSKPVLDDEALRIARIHPDLLYRETPENLKGTASPIDKVPEEANAGAETDMTETAGVSEETAETTPDVASTEDEEEDDNWQPDYPPVYEDDLSAGKPVKNAAKTEDDESWAADYPPEYDDSDVVRTEKTSTTQEEEGGWLSWILPESSDKEEAERESGKIPAPVPPDKLPYPVPKDIEELETADVTPDTQNTDFMSLASLPPSQQTVTRIPSPESPSSLENQAHEAMPETETAAKDTETAIEDDTTDILEEEAKALKETEDIVNKAEKAGEDEVDHAENSVEDSVEKSAEESIKKAESIPEPQTPGTEPDLTASSEPVTGEVATASGLSHAEHKTKTVSSSSKTSRTGWFSWLWPASWKGENSETSRHTAPAIPAQKEPEYHAASEPPPSKDKGPVWIWK